MYVILIRYLEFLIDFFLNIKEIFRKLEFWIDKIGVIFQRLQTIIYNMMLPCNKPSIEKQTGVNMHLIPRL